MDVGKRPLFSRVNEADLTFGLVQLIATSPSLRKTLTSEIVGTTEQEFIGVTRSVRIYDRETDIRWEYADVDGHHHIILLENKIGANFGKNQIEDYQNRVDMYIEDERCDIVKVGLIAPEGRLKPETADRFDFVITYERVRDELDTLNIDSAPFYRRLFSMAIEQQKPTDKSGLMDRLEERVKTEINARKRSDGEVDWSRLNVESTGNRVRVKSNSDDFTRILHYIIRAKFSGLGTISAGVQVTTDDEELQKVIHKVISSNYNSLPLEPYTTRVGEYDTKQGIVEWTAELPGDPNAVAEEQVEEAAEALSTIIGHYHPHFKQLQ